MTNLCWSWFHLHVLSFFVSSCWTNFALLVWHLIQDVFKSNYKPRISNFSDSWSLLTRFEIFCFFAFFHLICCSRRGRGHDGFLQGRNTVDDLKAEFKNIFLSNINFIGNNNNYWKMKKQQNQDIFWFNNKIHSRHPNRITLQFMHSIKNISRMFPNTWTPRLLARTTRSRLVLYSFWMPSMVRAVGRLCRDRSVSYSQR